MLQKTKEQNIKKGWDPEPILHSICAFANDFEGYSGGYIVIGVDAINGIPQFPILGIDINDIDRIESEVLEYCKKCITPSYVPSIEVVEYDGKKLIVLWVYQGYDKPYEYLEHVDSKESKTKKCYIRKGSSTIIANPSEIKDSLFSGGILTFNTFDPWPIYQVEQMNTPPDDYTFRLEYINNNGNKEKIYNAISYNPFLQHMHGNWKFVEYDKDGNIIGERIRPLLMRQTYRSEIFLLAELCGYEVLDIYRGYHGDKEDLNDPMSAANYKGNLIWILKKK